MKMNPRSQLSLHSFVHTSFVIGCIFVFVFGLYAISNQTVQAATVTLPGSSGAGGFEILPSEGSNTSIDSANNSDLDFDSNSSNGTEEENQNAAANEDFPLGEASLLESKGGDASGDSAPTSLRSLEDIIVFIGKILNKLAPFIVALTLFFFLWGIFGLVRGGDEDARKEGKKIMVFGIIALFVMVSVWGLVNILIRSFKLTGAERAPQGPGVPNFK